VNRRQRPRGSVFSGGSPFVAMMKPADLRYRHDPPHFRWLNRSRFGRVLVRGKMLPRLLIVLQITSQGSTQRSFMEHNYMIETLATDGPDHALDVGSLPRGPRGRKNFADPHVSQCSRKPWPKIASRSRNR
jgi:hypothetical protein